MNHIALKLSTSLQLARTGQITRNLLLSTFLSCAILPQSSFAMNDDVQKNEERKIILSFQETRANILAIQVERKGGPVTQGHMTTLFTNQVIINILPESKKKNFLQTQNQALLQTIIDINLSKQFQRS